MTEDMKEGNTDVRYAFSSMLDSIVELFNGKLSFTELLNMDMPMTRSLVKARLENLENRNKKSKSPDEFEKLISRYLL